MHAYTSFHVFDGVSADSPAACGKANKILLKRRNAQWNKKT